MYNIYDDFERVNEFLADTMVNENIHHKISFNEKHSKPDPRYSTYGSRGALSSRNKKDFPNKYYDAVDGFQKAEKANTLTPLHRATNMILKHSNKAANSISRGHAENVPKHTSRIQALAAYTQKKNNEELDNEANESYGISGWGMYDALTEGIHQQINDNSAGGRFKGHMSDSEKRWIRQDATSDRGFLAEPDDAARQHVRSAGLRGEKHDPNSSHGFQVKIAGDKSRTVKDLRDRDAQDYGWKQREKIKKSAQHQYFGKTKGEVAGATRGLIRHAGRLGKLGSWQN